LWRHCLDVFPLLILLPMMAAREMNMYPGCRAVESTVFH